MLAHMRTTMNLPDALFAEVKARAHEEGRTVTSVVEAALRDYIDRSLSARSREPWVLPRWDGGPPRIDLEDKDAMYEAMYGEEDARYRADR